jgi:hypothetical protein
MQRALQFILIFMSKRIFSLCNGLVTSGKYRWALIEKQLFTSKDINFSHAVINNVRDSHPEYIFTYKYKPINHMLNTAGRKARIRAALPEDRVHYLQHTFGRRLRAVGVSFEDRQDLLGHKSARITPHYSSAELTNLLIAVEKVSDRHIVPSLTLIKHAVKVVPAKVPQSNLISKLKIA